MINPLALTKEDQERVGGATAVIQELRQFRRLAHLDDEEVAFRTVKTLDEVRAIRRLLGQHDVPLRETSIPYRLRLILGKHKISTTGHLLRMTDAELLALRGIGNRSLEQIRTALQEIFQ